MWLGGVLARALPRLCHANSGRLEPGCRAPHTNLSPPTPPPHTHIREAQAHCTHTGDIRQGPQGHPPYLHTHTHTHTYIHTHTHNTHTHFIHIAPLPLPFCPPFMGFYLKRHRALCLSPATGGYFILRLTFIRFIMPRVCVYMFFLGRLLSCVDMDTHALTHIHTPHHTHMHFLNANLIHSQGLLECEGAPAGEMRPQVGYLL